MKAIIAVASLLALSGCAAGESFTSSLNNTVFEPFDDGRFVFYTHNKAPYPMDAAGEAYRIEWLEEALTLNKLCLKGYVIDERKQVKRWDVVYDVWYYGHCKGTAET